MTEGHPLNAKRALPVAFVWCMLLFGCQLAQAGSKAIIFAHANVVSMDGDRILADQDVTVIDDRIVSIQQAANTHVPRNAQVIDATGKFLMPGLGEMHAHLPEPADSPEYMRTTLALYVANGVTTVRCMRGFPNHLSAREGVISGTLLGPSLFLAGPGLGGDSVTSPDDGAKQVLRQKLEGWDMIKIYPGLTRAEYDAIMTAARSIGMRTGGHVPSDVGVEHALQTGQETIEHLDGYWEALHFEKLVPDETLKAMAIKTREAGVWNAPTMAIVRFTLCMEPLQRALAKQEIEYLPKSQVERWVKLSEDVVCKGHSDLDVSRIVQQNRERFLKELNEVGAPILFGTDSPNLFEVPGFSVYEELAAMQQAGLLPYDVLLSATRRVGEYLRKNVGTVTVGAQADLILLDANPLDDVANVRKQAGVMLRGRWFAHSELQRILQRIRDLRGNYRVPSEKGAARTTCQNETPKGLRSLDGWSAIRKLWPTSRQTVISETCIGPHCQGRHVLRKNGPSSCPAHEPGTGEGTFQHALATLFFLDRSAADVSPESVHV
jgi:imidazolonepropionase-like amidohydrolase